MALMGFQPELFKDVGLLVFDECHLLHAGVNDRSRRAVDAMLCILNLSTHAPMADYLLLSAMMSNTEEVAAWLAELTGRKCLPLNMAWKPTRQVRGSVVFPSDQIAGLRNRLAAKRQELSAAGKSKSGPPAALKRELKARPLGLLGLKFRWDSMRRDDYVLLPLSGGEMQRIALARAILKDAPIVVLDEASSFADPENEAKIQKAFEALMKGKTVLMIAHRLSTVRNMDRILVIRDGEIAEEGKHDELLEKGGVYAAMWEEYQKAAQWKVGGAA